MPYLQNFKGKSQFDDDIAEQYRQSACGPVTAFVLLRHLALEFQINALYRKLGGSKIGLFKWRFIRNLRKLLGTGWIVEECTVDEAKVEISNGRAVAAKFDKWFSFHWNKTYSFDYHWVPVVGYKETEAGLVLLVHDNGSRHRTSQIREIPYTKNRDILSFVKVKKTTAS